MLKPFSISILTLFALRVKTLKGVSKMLKTIDEVKKELNGRKCRSAWDRGVNAYALELLDNLAAALAWQQLEQIPEDWKTCKADVLNGASDWSEFLGAALP